MSLRSTGWRLAGKNAPPQIVWPRQMGDNVNPAMDRIFEIFPDKYPVLVKEADEAWTFDLTWPRHLLEPIDLALPERAQACYGLQLEHLADYLEVQRYGQVDFVFSMFHSRAMLAPALAAARRG